MTNFITRMDFQLSTEATGPLKIDSLVHIPYLT